MYEYWVLFRVMSIMETLLPDVKWSFWGRWDDQGVRKVLERRVFDPLGLIGYSKEKDVDIQLTYQERFPAYHSTREVPKKRAMLKEDFRSITGTMIPDLFLRIRRGAQIKAVVLDAKYRTAEQAIKEALDDLHVYKNGLRYQEQSVRGAFPLVPVYEQKVAGYVTSEYRDRFQFGGFQLHPTETDDAELLRGWPGSWTDTIGE